MIAARLFRWLFGRGRRDRFEVSLGSVLARAAARNLAAAGGLAAAPIETAALVAELQSLGPGTSIAELRDSDIPQLLLLIPDSSAAAAGPVAAVGGAWRFAAGVGDFLGLETAGGVRRAHSYAKRYGAEDHGALAWLLSGRRSFRLAPDGEAGAVYASVDDSTASRIERAFAEDEGYAEAVRSWALAETAPAVGAGDPPRRLEIRAPREFVLGSLLAPLRVSCGKYILETRFTAVAENAPRLEAGAWVRGTCGLAGTQWSAWYFFPSARAEVARGLASCLFRDALRRLAGAFSVDPEKPAVVTASPPDQGSGRFVAMSAEIHAGKLRLPLEVLVAQGALVPLIRALCDAAELAPRPGGAPRSVLPLLFSLNQSLLRRELPSLRGAIVEKGARGQHFSFAAFLDLLPDRDVALLLQNHVPRALGGRSLRALLGYRAGAATIVTPSFVDEERLLRFLPQAGREAWERDAGDEQKAGTFAELVALNREVLAGAWRAARSRSLLLSPRALSILEDTVVPELRRDSLAKIAGMAAAGRPFAGLRELPEPRVQQVLAALPARALCLSLLGVPAERAYVEARSSRTRRSRIEEDLALLGGRFARGEIEADEVLDAMREISDAVAAAIAKAESPAGR